jgi:hypothetical protein
MDILNNIDWRFIFIKLLFLVGFHIYYKYVLKLFGKHLLQSFIEKYSNKNNSIIFITLCSLYYSFQIITIIFILCGFLIATMFTKGLEYFINYNIMIAIVTFIYFFKELLKIKKTNN